jgi:2-dehydro-3-deoxyphosphogluconate aldolase/(4S)-4-hydroxy-2-oxoglutarate aldolase
VTPAGDGSGPLARLADIGVVPVVTIERAEQARDLGAALISGGVPCVEVTLRTPAALSAIEAMAGAVPDLLVGVGTVLHVAQAREAVAAGARFVMSPLFDDVVVDWCMSHGVVVVPGVMSPSEIGVAVRRGLEVVKYFPAGPAGGIAALRAFEPVFPGVRFVPTGGVDADNLADFLRLPAVAACGGSWLAPRELIATGRFDRIEQLAAEAATTVRDVRSGR